MTTVKVLIHNFVVFKKKDLEKYTKKVEKLEDFKELKKIKKLEKMCQEKLANIKDLKESIDISNSKMEYKGFALRLGISLCFDCIVYMTYDEDESKNKGQVEWEFYCKQDNLEKVMTNYKEHLNEVYDGVLKLLNEEVK